MSQVVTERRFSVNAIENAQVAVPTEVSVAVWEVRLEVFGEAWVVCPEVSEVVYQALVVVCLEGAVVVPRHDENELLNGGGGGNPAVP